ncbi:MAG: 30S ribosomal protein S13 [Candidatus Woesearchaeota archaeon]
MAHEEKKQDNFKQNRGKASEPAQKFDKDYKHIVRIANVDIPGEKKLGIALTKIKGIGINFANAICTVAKVPKETKTGYLTNEQITSLNNVTANFEGIPTWMYNRKKDYETGLDKHLVTGTLAFVKDNDLKKLKMIKTYKGVRHQKGLTVRGQRTRSNFRKQKGKVVGVKKKAPQSAGGKK